MTSVLGPVGCGWWRRVPLLAGGAALLAFTVLCVRLQPGPVWDDPYIFFRYARNIANGSGWTYNPGVDSPNAVTSTAYVTVLAGLALVGVTVEFASTLVWVVALSGAGLILALLLWRAGQELAAPVAAALVVALPSITFNRGMETALVLATTLAVVLVARSRHAFLFGVLAAMLVLTRPDSVVVLVGILASELLLHRSSPGVLMKQPVRMLSGALVMLVPWIGFSLVKFGSLLPSTLAAKQAQFASGRWGSYIHGLYRYPYTHEQKYFFWIAVILCVIGVVGAVSRPSVWPLLVPLGAGAVLQMVAYGLVLRVPFYPWYYALPTLVAVIFMALGVDVLACLLRPVRLRAALVAVSVALVATYGVGNLPRHPAESRQNMATIGSWLAANTPENSTVAANEFGMLGWHSDRPMIDYLGLLDPTMNEYVRKNDFVSWAYDLQPDYFVTWTDPTWRLDWALTGEPWFPQTFRPVFRSGVLTVYERVGPVPRD